MTTSRRAFVVAAALTVALAAGTRGIVTTDVGTMCVQPAQASTGTLAGACLPIAPRPTQANDATVAPTSTKHPYRPSTHLPRTVPGFRPGTSTGQAAPTSTLRRPADGKGATTPVPAPADTAPGTGRLPFASATTAGLHNTYNPAAFRYLAQGLDTGTGMIELDTWPDTTAKQWRVSHSHPHRNVNNCTHATTAAQLYSGSTHSNLETCLDDVRIWLSSHPGAGPLVVKLELKAGFATSHGMGPSQLDALIAGHLGNMVFRPADLLPKPAGGSYTTAADAARADNWPTRSELAGRVLLYAIPGSDTPHPDVELGHHLRDLAATGDIGRAQVFPAVHGATAGDPRTAYEDTAIRPWFVVFDGDASSYLDGLNTTWYDTNHYLLTMTDAHKVAPALSATRPSSTQVRARTRQLATAHATIVSSDWRQPPDAQSLVLPRGHPGSRNTAEQCGDGRTDQHRIGKPSK
ncbi:phosphatidylinositol-specific phospholipase C domain-containing protein [Streptomyces sp. WAC8370]|uniref:phosphatidylinositol-specific phospholipase C domain-containing protein n=1 Tax=Streptomyces sp. WAC8370 TaxID=3351348 RepID=UPI003F793E1B